MTFAVSGALQRAVYELLQADPGLTALVGDAVYDHVPAGEEPPLFVSLGPDEVRDRSTQTSGMAEHRFAVSVVSAGEGFEAGKAVAATVSDALIDARPPLMRGRVISLTLLRARARRVRGRIARRVDLTFRAIVEDN